MKSRLRGFTLVELMIAIIIVAGLAAITIPIARSAIGKSRQASCVNNLRQLGTGLELYLQENFQRMPEWQQSRASENEDVPVLETELVQYLGDSSVFECPADREEYRKTGSSYSWNPLVNGQNAGELELGFGGFVITDNPSRIPLILDKENWHPGGGGEGSKNYLYADQTAEKRLRLSVGN